MREYKVTKWNGEDLMPLADQWARECGIDDYAPDVALSDSRAMSEGENSDVFVLVTPEGRVVGGMGIGVQDMFYTRDFYSGVRYWYIEPGYRSMALKLIAKARRWSIEKGCTKLMLCSNRLCSPSDKFLKALQFKEYETVYIRNV